MIGGTNMGKPETFSMMITCGIFSLIDMDRISVIAANERRNGMFMNNMVRGLRKFCGPFSMSHH
jgi:hypothetical protein